MKKSKEKKQKDCFDCEECLYICEGDYICAKGNPKIVLTNHNCPTEDYMWCTRTWGFRTKGKNKKK